MDRAEQPPLSLLGGQLKLGLREESKKETLWEDLWSFAVGLILYLYRRIFGLLSGLVRFLFSGFTLSEQFKFWLSRRFVRRKGQLAFPFAHATLVSVSLTLLVAAGGLGGIIFQKPKPDSSPNPFILESNTSLTTEESLLTKLEAFSYEVKDGDDVYSIAQSFRRTVDALVSANGGKIKESYDENGVVIYTVETGETLTIPSVSGSTFKVRPGDTLSSFAKRYGADPQQIVEFNYLMDLKKEFYPGRELFVPTVVAYLAGDFSALSGSCSTDFKIGWPVRNRTLTGAYTAAHRGIDLSADYEPLYAVADGRIAAVSNRADRCLRFDASCNYGYGGLVFIDLFDKEGKPTGLQARYGHISKPAEGLSVGQLVKKGDVVAISGESGVTFGPHLHFEIYCGSIRQRVNPLNYLE